MSLLGRLFRIKIKKIRSDFLTISSKYSGKKIIFVDLGCRGESTKFWPKKGPYLKYIGIDASESVINELKKNYSTYSGNVDASFINAIVSNNNSEQLFASSSEGMTDGLVIDNPKDNINVNDIYLKKVHPISLKLLLKEFDDDLNMKDAIKVLKIDIEGNSSSIVDDYNLIKKFDIVLAEVLPRIKNQFKTMSSLEECEFSLINVERAFRWGKDSSKELFILDTEWRNNISQNLLKEEMLSKPNFFSRTSAIFIYLLVSILYKFLKNKAYSSISDSDLGW